MMIVAFVVVLVGLNFCQVSCLTLHSGVISRQTVTATRQRTIYGSGCLGRLSSSATEEAVTNSGSESTATTATSLTENSQQEIETSSSITVDETNPRSVFGTKDYWDDVYLGRGDFPSEQYSWYFGWEVLSHIVETYVPKKETTRILIPGIGNDSILLDLYKAGYRNLVGQDYSEHAVERQYDLLSYEGIPCNLDDEDDTNDDVRVHILQGDVTNLPESWSAKANQFDVILEKGLLDAVYLSGGDNIEAAVQNLQRVLRRGGLMISVSGVVPGDLRKSLFAQSSSSSSANSNDNGQTERASTWEWLMDGSDDLKAGCFVLKKN